MKVFNAESDPSIISESFNKLHMTKQSQENFFYEFVDKVHGLKREKTALKNELEQMINNQKNSQLYEL